MESLYITPFTKITQTLKIVHIALKKRGSSIFWMPTLMELIINPWTGFQGHGRNVILILEYSKWFRPIVKSQKSRGR